MSSSVPVARPAVGAATRPDPVDGRAWGVGTWRRIPAVIAPLLATVLGGAMAVQWELGGGRAAGSLPQPARWMAENLPLVDGDEPVWMWRGPFFVTVVLALPLVWAVTGHAASALPRHLTRVGLLAAAVAIGLEYNSPGWGWVFDLVALLVALVGTVWCGVQAIRRDTLPRRVAWSLVAALPLTPVGGVLTYGYLPPALTVGTLLAWAVAALVSGGDGAAPAERG